LLILKLLESPAQTNLNSGYVFEISQNGPQVLGRRPDCDLHLDHPNVSSEHAQFVAKDSGWYVEDLGSRNGTLINGRRLQPRSPKFCEQRLLCDGDQVTVGGFVFQADLQGHHFDPPAEPAKSVRAAATGEQENLKNEEEQGASREDQLATVLEHDATFEYQDADSPDGPIEPQDYAEASDNLEDDVATLLEHEKTFDSQVPQIPDELAVLVPPDSGFGSKPVETPPQPPVDKPDAGELEDLDQFVEPDFDRSMAAPGQGTPPTDPFLSDPDDAPIVAEPANPQRQGAASFVEELDQADHGRQADTFERDVSSYAIDDSQIVPVDGPLPGPDDVTLQPQQFAQADAAFEERQQTISQLGSKLRKAQLPDALWPKIQGHLDQLETIDWTSQPCSQLIKYLQILAALPWNRSSDAVFDLLEARTSLDRTHFGLSRVKRQLIDFLAARKLNPTGPRPILCLVGPMGVGKTSLARSVAKALGRKSIIVDCQQLSDESSILGRRRAETAATPGRVMDQIGRIKVNNPVIILDQLDKLDPSKTDVALILRDLMDRNKNRAFVDAYLDLPFDLSRAVFVATADFLDPVAVTLTENLETIEIPAYTENDKVQIARRHLIPRRLRANGLKAKDSKWFNTAVRRIISGYTREAGVSELEQQLELICRSLAARVAQKRGKARPAVIRPERISHWLGPAKYTPDAGTKPAGVIPTACCTRGGGDILYVEATAYPGQGQINLTGHPSTVMRETAQGVLSLLKSGAKAYHFDVAKVSNLDVHLHVPADALPNDAPSAGLAMYTALVSLLLDLPIKPHLTIAAQISLAGRMLPVGSLHERAVAAIRDEFKTMILPTANKPHVQELDQDVQRKLKFEFVDSVDQVVEMALGKRAVTQAIKQNLDHLADASATIEPADADTLQPSDSLGTFDAGGTLAPDKSPDIFYEAALKFVEDEVPTSQSPGMDQDVPLADQIVDWDDSPDLAPAPSAPPSEDLGWWADVTDEVSPKIPPGPEPETPQHEITPQPQAQPEPEAKPEPELKTKPEPEAKPPTKAKPEPKPKRKRKPKPEPYSGPTVKLKLFNVATLVSLLLGLLFGGLWARSYWVSDQVHLSSNVRHRQIISHYGCLTYTRADQPIEKKLHWEQNPLALDHGLDAVKRLWLFEKNGELYRYSVTFPYWLIAGPLLLIPLMRLIYYLRRGGRVPAPVEQRT